MIRNMTLSDVERVHQIEMLCFSVPWTKASIISEFTNTNSHWRVMELGGEIAAYAGLWIIFDEAHIMNIAVAPEHRKKGFGEMMVRDMFKVALENDAMRMTLEVRETNIEAQRLYRKLGFIKAGIRRAYYPDGEDAWLFWNDDIRQWV